MTRQESFHSLVHRHAMDSQKIKLLASLKTSHDLWPPGMARGIARSLRETADVIDEVAEREPR